MELKSIILICLLIFSLVCMGYLYTEEKHITEFPLFSKDDGKTSITDNSTVNDSQLNTIIQYDVVNDKNTNDKNL